MDYISEAKALYDEVGFSGLPTSAIALWNAIAFCFGRKGWPESLIIKSTVLQAMTALTSRQAVNEARKKLKEAGLIDFQKRDGNQSARYNMIFASSELTQNHTQMETQNHTQPLTQNHTQMETQEKPLIIDVSSGDSLDMSNTYSLPPNAPPDTKTLPSNPPSPARKKKSEKRTYEHDSKHYMCAKWLADDVQDKASKKIPRPTEAHLQAWADTMRKMEEIDKIPWADIRSVLKWARDDETFWQGVVQSCHNFRENYGRIVAKMGTAKRNQGQGATQQPERKLGDGLKGGASGLE